VGHADFYHRIDIRETSRRLVVRDGDQVIADADHPALYESGFARAGMSRAMTSPSRLSNRLRTDVLPYKGLASYYDIADGNGGLVLRRACRRFRESATWCRSSPTRSTSSSMHAAAS